jgi:hypothetical protein
VRVPAPADGAVEAGVVVADARERTPRAAIDDAEWHGGRLRIHGHTYLDPPGPEAEVRLWLRDLATEQELVVPVEQASEGSG